MKFKNLGALFLLSLASIYFICPIQCAAIQEAGENRPADRASSHHQHRIVSQTVDETHQSTCCRSENEPSASQERQDEEGHCCFNQWESLAASEPQLALQIQKEIFLSVVLIPATPRISSDSVSFTVYLQPRPKPYTNLPIPQLSPRAPPFFLA
ncbi:hypothetical protein C6502_03325 [Candidatus Poribacteria bacterium]|nr:MAG: hypothetical protein C6502_03325 [Candidatus Poribacteria bacterium]